jgi:hypothetical protein
MDNTGYTFLKWNGRYGAQSEFVVKNNSNQKQGIFTPGRENDIAWVKDDLTKSHTNWDDFGNETVSNLKDVCF